MELIIALLAALVIILGFIVFKFFKTISSDSKEPKNNSMVLLQNQVAELSRAVDAKLGEVPKMMREQFGESAKMIKEITGELTKVSEGQKQVVSLADQLRGLEDILKNPKQRGVLGEYFLENILKNVFSEQDYQMQYKFDGEDIIVDAVIFIDEKVVPIDSKFSLENYNRLIEAKEDSEKVRLSKLFTNDLKERIKESTK